MATINKQWSNGDALTLVTDASGISVSSAQNLTGAPRQMQVTVQTTQGSPQQSKLVTINQAALTKKLYTTGNNQAGQLGLGDLVNRDVLTQVGSFNWDMIASKGSHTLGISGGKLYAWGNNANGQLGLGNTTNVSIPTRIGTYEDWTFVACGFYHSLAIRNGELYACGYNNYGQLGLGNSSQKTSFTRVGTGTAWTDISAGDYYSMGIMNGNLYTWGIGGAYGTGRSATQTSPATVLGITNCQKISAGSIHSLIIINNGELYACGNGLNYQLGTGRNISTASFTRIGTGTAWTDISAGSYNSAGIMSNKLYTWGKNDKGEVGNGTSGAGCHESSPLQIGNLDWDTVKSGNEFTVAFRNGEIYATGLNDKGQLGLGDLVNRNVFTKVGSNSDWNAIYYGTNELFATR